MGKAYDYWTLEKCREVASNFSSRSEFQKCKANVYARSRRKGWLDDVCSHMVVLGNRYKRCVYLIYTKNEVYVGITYDFNKRNHLRSGRKEVVNIRKKGNYVQLTNYLTVIKACQIEKDLIKYFKNNPNIKCLNIKAGGDLGTSPKIILEI